MLYVVGKFNLEALEVVSVTNCGCGVGLCEYEDKVLDKKITLHVQASLLYCKRIGSHV